MCLNVDFLPIFEGEPYIILTVDGHIIHQSAPKGSFELVHQFRLFQDFEKGFNLCPARLLASTLWCYSSAFPPFPRRLVLPFIDPSGQERRKWPKEKKSFLEIFADTL